VIIDPFVPGFIYTGGFDGLFWSLDGGDYWVDIGQNFPPDSIFGICGNVQTLAADPVNPGTFYAAASPQDNISITGTVFKTVDWGSSWDNLTTRFFVYDNCYTLTVDPDVPHEVYAGMFAFNAVRYEYLQGIGWHWTHLSIGHTWNLALHPDNSHHIYRSVGYPSFTYTPHELNILNLSTSRGLGWEDAHGDLHGRQAMIPAICFDSQDSGHMYLGTYEGVFTCYDLSYDWQPRHEGFRGPVEQISLAVDDDQTVIYTCGRKGMHKSVDSGQTWTYAGLRNAWAVAVRPDEPNIAFAFENFGPFQEVYYHSYPKQTTDGGTSWRYTGGGIGEPWHDDWPRPRLVFDPINPDIIYLPSGSQLYKSIDGGVNWDQCRCSLYGSDTYILAVALKPQNPDKFYVGSSNGEDQEAV